MRDNGRRARAAAPLLTLALVVGVGLAVVAATDRAEVVPAERADATPPSRTPRPAPSPIPTSCIVPNPQPRPTDPITSWDWLSSPLGRTGERPDFAVRRTLDAIFGSNNEDAATQLRRGVIGLASDFGRHELVAVVDPALIDAPGLEKRLREAAYDESTGADASDLTVRVGAACHSRDELLAAYNVIRARAYHPDAKRWDYELNLDPNTSVYDVNVSSAVVGAALQERLGELVRVTCCYRPKEPLY